MLLKIKRNLHDFENICQLHLVSSSLLAITVFFEYVVLKFGFSSLLFLILSLFLLKTYYLSLKKLQYTYWSLTLFVFSIVLYSIFSDRAVQVVPLFGFLSLKLIEVYLVSSPIFYPVFNWWEYDFRYRNDLKAFVAFNDTSQEARVTDIRRSAACIILFEKLPIGSSIVVTMHENQNTLIIEGKIISVRETTLGRGYSYGVSFSWENNLTREYYSQMKKSWNKVRLEKKRDRFETRDTNLQQ
jgi:hypothetical protein